MVKVLVLGGGGREHAIAQKLLIEGTYVLASPGNPGMRRSGVQIVPLDLNNFDSICRLVRDEAVDFVVPGSETLLNDGVVDYCRSRGVHIFGPTMAAAQIEASKSFCCKLLEKEGVPIPSTTYYSSWQAMADTVKGSQGGIVLKKDGLAAGKGAEVIRVEADLEPALANLKALGDGMFLVQEMLSGPEVSFFVAVDGEEYAFMGSAMDYKPLYPNGPNTGGMGGFSPNPLVDDDLKGFIQSTIVRPTLRGMIRKNRRYTGVMYFQLMLTDTGPVVIEINCRFGDPEAQLILPLIGGDNLFYRWFISSPGNLTTCARYTKFGGSKTVGIVVASEGYPAAPKIGRPITMPSDEFVRQRSVRIYHAGTKQLDDGTLVTNGGRVFTVVGEGRTYTEAKRNAMEVVEQIQFEGAYYRTDIANEAIIFD